MKASEEAHSAGQGLKADLISAIPSLRAFAVSICGNSDRADDLVQETLVKAWGSLATFSEGTNLTAWLFTILRNIYYSEFRKRRREAPDPDGLIAGRIGRAGLAARAYGFSRLPRRDAKTAARSARSADPGRRVRHVI